jgi:serine/threonine protein phosphatase PrpC
MIACDLTHHQEFRGKTFNIEYASCAIQGRRDALEDMLLIDTSLNCYAVFDGHLGRHCSSFLACNWSKLSSNCSLDHDADIVRMFLEIDHTFYNKVIQQYGHITEVNDEGSTATVLYVRQMGNNHLELVCCNAGDSRCILFDGQDCIQLSEDHKPYLPTEKLRIEKHGGFVYNNRLNGDLALSRAFGDFIYKNNQDNGDRGDQLLTTEPEIIRRSIHISEDKIQFAIVACDGLFDVMTNSEIIQFVTSRLQEQTEHNINSRLDLSKIVRELIEHAIVVLEGSDNISVILLVFRREEDNNSEDTSDVNN